MIEISSIPSLAVFGNLRKMFGNVHLAFGTIWEIFGKWSEIFGKSSKMSTFNFICYIFMKLSKHAASIHNSI